MRLILLLSRTDFLSSIPVPDRPNPRPRGPWLGLPYTHERMLDEQHFHSFIFIKRTRAADQFAVGFSDHCLSHLPRRG